MKIVAILGSPRKQSNSTYIATSFCDAAQKNGAQIEKYFLSTMSYKGCKGCMVCKNNDEGSCIINDDLTEVLANVKKADVLVLASPVYFCDVSSQLKGFIDRTFSFLKPDFLERSDPSRLDANKTLVFVQTQGSPNKDDYIDVFKRYSLIYKIFGFKVKHLRALDSNFPKRFPNRDKILQSAKNLAIEICENST